MPASSTLHTTACNGYFQAARAWPETVERAVPSRRVDRDVETAINNGR
jgi:hypothetical protein